MNSIKTGFAVVFFLSGSPFLVAQDPCPCCSAPYSAFDFWLGDWTVYNSTGEVVGTNRIVEMQDGCVLQENWKATDQSNSGTSYNYFDRTDSTWNQIWISNSGFILELSGNTDSSGVMVLKSDLLSNQNGTYYHRITWTKNGDNSVTQKWDILDKEHGIISEAFMGIYRKDQKHDL
ncbi:MAG: hypothetical protein EHM46_01445 [Bacteroidetes bacterium]|nr:MAG: hypothetical protein EHM46_01445 [Bacteroidota bacterium]